jgi:hypothetical protein
MDESTITKFAARESIESLGEGEPPSDQVAEFVSVGLETDMDVFKREYFDEDALLPNTDQGTFKIVEAYYGGGKSHYLKSVVRLARAHGFASAFVELKKDSCPLTRFDLIYGAVAAALTVVLPDGRLAGPGIDVVLREWLRVPESSDMDALAYVDEQLGSIGNIPIQSIKIAMRIAAHSMATGDQQAGDEALVYLQSGKISAGLRRQGVLEVIDQKSGSRALSSLARWLRQMGVPGLVLVMDEGDRSLSIASSKDRKTAADNLVHLINEATRGKSWPGVLFLYSIPSWQDFTDVLAADNIALEQRVRGTGFPDFPPAPRIVLEARYDTDPKKIAFCSQIGQRLTVLYNIAYPESLVPDDAASQTCQEVARTVVAEVADVSFLRSFIQTYLRALYERGQGRTPRVPEIRSMIRPPSHDDARI